MRLNTQIIGNIGVHSVMIELAKRGVKSWEMPSDCHWDIITYHGKKLEVKLANLSTDRNKKRGYSYQRFRFFVTPRELKYSDFVILIINADQEFLYYIIPTEEVTGKCIAFNPFTRCYSKYLRFRDCWGLLLPEEVQLQAIQSEIDMIQNVLGLLG